MDKVCDLILRFLGLVVYVVHIVLGLWDGWTCCIIVWRKKERGGMVMWKWHVAFAISVEITTEADARNLWL